MCHADSNPFDAEVGTEIHPCSRLVEICASVVVRLHSSYLLPLPITSTKNQEREEVAKKKEKKGKKEKKTKAKQKPKQEKQVAKEEKLPEQLLEFLREGWETCTGCKGAFYGEPRVTVVTVRDVPTHPVRPPLPLPCKANYCSFACEKRHHSS